jgi:hypothetical protein
MHGEDPRKHPFQGALLGRFLGVVENAELTHRSFELGGVLFRQIHGQGVREPTTKGVKQHYPVAGRNTVIKDDQEGSLSVERFLPVRLVANNGKAAWGKFSCRQAPPHLSLHRLIFRRQ